jgi:hypothetical protein
VLLRAWDRLVLFGRDVERARIGALSLVEDPSQASAVPA